MNLANQFVAAFEVGDRSTIRKLLKKHVKKFPETCLEANIQLLFEEKKFDQAISKIEQYESLVDISQIPVGSMLVFAQILLHEKRSEKALKYLRRVIELDPKGKTAPELMFWLFFNESNWENSEKVLNRLISASANEKSYLVWKLILKSQQEKFDDVLTLFDLIKPLFCHDMERFDEVAHAVFFAHVYKKSPSELKRFVEQFDLFSSKSLNVRMCEPTYHLKHYDRKSAIEAYTRIIDDFPEKAEPRWNRALLYLAEGQIKKGFDEYEARWDWEKFPSPKRFFDCPKWNAEPLAGRRILVWAEQGLGDELMFLTLLNYLLVLEPRKVVLEVSPKLVEVVQSWYPTCEVRQSGPDQCAGNTEYSIFDYHIPSGSLCKFFADRLIESTHHDDRRILINKSYRSRDALTGNWAAKYPYLIGISWRSAKLTTARNTAYLNHKLVISALEHLPNNVGLLVLQYGMSQKERDALDGIDRVFVPQVEFFDNVNAQAEFINACDLIVSPHTISLHLAGIQNKPTLSWVGEGAWTRLGREQFPWYQNIIHVYTAGISAKGAVVLAVCNKLKSIFMQINDTSDIIEN